MALMIYNLTPEFMFTMAGRGSIEVVPPLSRAAIATLWAFSMPSLIIVVCSRWASVWAAVCFR
ncbi:uncharacterized protein M6B38_376075 [Iris pallida]|uniref:Uncharacterized protein n=1 Tax=Iris pallida TaxID=29817 RepID=A0AAX6G9Q2_IRIPA|nr:uncharacterized protein M6B38_376075 [Iris pallida]